MSLKAGRVGVAPDQVDEFGKIHSDATQGYTKQEADAKFQQMQLEIPIKYLNGSSIGLFETVQEALSGSYGEDGAMTNMELTEKAFLPQRVLSSSDNLNDVKGIGFYTISSSPTNAPDNVAYCNLTVYPTGDNLDGTGGLIQMILWRGAMYVRGYTGSPLAWTNWIKYTGTTLQ